MEYIIKNEFLEAIINSHGAELIKLIDIDGVNRMHSPSSDTWNRVSPILFPQISRMPNSEYVVNIDKEYIFTVDTLILVKEDSFYGDKVNNTPSIGFLVTDKGGLFNDEFKKSDIKFYQKHNTKH